MAWFFALHVGLLGVIWCFCGYKGVLFQLAYSLVGVFFIEMVNYIEHYGLVRKKDARGIYEPISEKHSWNACSSTLLFRIQRHSDHHMHAYRPYQILRKFDTAPQLPFDYLYSMLLALWPRAWFSIMHPKLYSDSTEQGQGGNSKELVSR